MTPYEIGRKLALEKIAMPFSHMLTEGRLPHAIEIAGLGILAAPTINDMIDPPWIQTEKRRHQGHVAELTGLGTLMVPSIASILKHHH